MAAGNLGCTKRSQTQPAQQQAWQAMRILRRFTLPHLLTTCPLLSHRTARHYVVRLRHCGYVLRVAQRISGQPGGADTYALVRNSGPLAPIARTQSISVYDPNTDRAWGEGGVELNPQAASRPPAMPAPTTTMRLALICILEGRPPQSVLPDPSNGGALAAVMKALRKRDLVDQAGALTEAGWAQAQAYRGWQP